MTPPLYGNITSFESQLLLGIGQELLAKSNPRGLVARPAPLDPASRLVSRN